jgi:hypothetical protein
VRADKALLFWHSIKAKKFGFTVRVKGEERVKSRRRLNNKEEAWK